jgi:hypothetical protein
LGNEMDSEGAQTTLSTFINANAELEAKLE